MKLTKSQERWVCMFMQWVPEGMAFTELPPQADALLKLKLLRERPAGLGKNRLPGICADGAVLKPMKVLTLTKRGIALGNQLLPF